MAALLGYRAVVHKSNKRLKLRYSSHTRFFPRMKSLRVFGLRRAEVRRSGYEGKLHLFIDVIELSNHGWSDTVSRSRIGVA